VVPPRQSIPYYPGIINRVLGAKVPSFE
jgi:hypothetical protein